MTCEIRGGLVIGWHCPTHLAISVVRLRKCYLFHGFCDKKCHLVLFYFLYWTDVDEHRMVLNYLESWKMPFLVSVDIWNEEGIAWLTCQGLAFNQHCFLRLLINENGSGLGKEKRKKIWNPVACRNNSVISKYVYFFPFLADKFNSVRYFHGFHISVRELTAKWLF